MRRPPPIAAYTLIEVMVAAALLMIGVAAASALAVATLTQEETNARTARCLNLHEQAVRLYQLGLDPAVATALLPPDPAVTSLEFTAQSTPINGLGTVETAVSTLTFSTTSTDQRSHEILAVRPAIR